MIELNYTTIIDSCVIITKLSLATLMGLLIGLERKKNDKSGGARTFSLVCIGACNIAILCLELLKVDIGMFDFTRLLSYGLASIGFIGSGVIIKDKQDINGVTTAATLWSMVILGFLIGLGYYFWGITTSILIYFILESKYNNKEKKDES